MAALDIEVHIDISSERFEHGIESVCFRVDAKRKESSEYVVYHCYDKGSNGRVRYHSSNEVKDVRGGIFAHLGQDPDVYKYFLELSRDVAVDHFFKDF